MTNLIVALKFTRSKLRGVILSQGKDKDLIQHVKIFALFFLPLDRHFCSERS